MTTSLEKTISSSALAPALVSEIVALHGQILTTARTTLDLAIRIGELLATQKASLKHGEWLPWQKDNLPFNQTTASNYMRLFSNRGKLATIANLELTDAYKMLAEPALPEATVMPSTDIGEPTPSESRFIPKPGTLLMLRGTVDRARCWVIIAPAVQSGFYHIAFSSGDTDGVTGGSAGNLEFTKKPVRADYVEHALEYMLRAPVAKWLPQMEVSELDGDEPWTYNHFAFFSHQNYIDQVIFGKRWRATA